MYISTVAAIERVCISCGAPFKTPFDKQLRCKKDCGRIRESRNAARTQRRADYKPEFICIDGEGVTLDDDSHRYVMLSVGEATLHREGAHLDVLEIFEFLWEQFCENPDAVYVGFYLGYDFTQWIRTLPQDRADILFKPERRARTKSGGNTTPFPTEYKDWEFDILGMKRFKLRKQGAKSWLYVCDVGGFYQQAFATAMLDWQDANGQPVELMTPDEREIIERGKAARATAKFSKAMIEYNVTENRVLSRMMSILAEGFADIDIRLLRDQWYGPGQVAQKWLDAHSTHTAKKLKAKADAEPAFAYALQAARKSFFGGWFEVFAHGHVPGETFEYDINSAYPDALSQLPCLLHGRWERMEGEGEGDLVLMRADVEGDNPFIGAMLHRDKQGRINRPNYTSGWYWKHELEAAKRAKLVCSVVAHESVVYHKCACPPPLAALRESFKVRRAVGKKTPRGRAIKLKDNSCYGKQAQSIGMPKHANAIYASLTTAHCRTKILDAIATHPVGAESVLLIATDGIRFQHVHPGLENQPEELGLWEAGKSTNLTIFLPGVYWDDKSREGRKTQALKLKSRGVSGADLIQRLDELDAGFSRMLNEPIPWTIGEGHVAPSWWLELTLPIRFSMVSPKQALQRGKWELCGTVTRNAERTLWAHPRHKRARVYAPTPERPYIHTGRPLNRERVESVPYNKAFGMALEIRQSGDYILTPEGDAMDDAYALIKGE